MGNSRPEAFQEILEGIIGKRADGRQNVYFQPPSTLKMVYPCIRYKRDSLSAIHANNLPYRHQTRYQVTVIDSDPDSTIPSAIANLPLCSFDRHYTADNLNHDVFNIYY